MVRVLEVIWIYDTQIDPQHWKMAVCVAPRFGLFFRINSNDHWKPAVAIREADHPFLQWDSYIECGVPLDLDDSLIEASLTERGVVGRIDRRVVAGILHAIDTNDLIAAGDKRNIRNALINVR